jgi:hemolysin D
VTERDGFALSPPEWDGDVPADVRAREEQSLGSEVGRFVTEWKALDAQRRQKVAETTRLSASVEAQKRLLATHDIRVGMRSELVDRAAGSKAHLLDAQEARQTQVVNLTSLEGQLGEARAAIDVIDAAKAQAVATFVAAQSQKLAEAERAVDELRERLEKARTRLEQTTVKAPIAGIVTALAVDGVGQVIGAGDEVMRIVPEDLRLELEAHVSNSDIGFVHVGQAVAVKIDSFPYARFGSIPGTVRRIAHDSVADPDAQASLVSPSGSPRSRSSGGTRHAQNLVFPVIVELDRQSMTVDGLDLPLAPGMTAVADIKTGSRRILEYLLSPLVETGARAFRER